MKGSEILQKIADAIEPLGEILTVFGVNAIPGVAVAKASLSLVQKIIASKPATHDWTDDEISAEVDKAKEDILFELDKMGITFDESEDDSDEDSTDLEADNE